MKADRKAPRDIDEYIAGFPDEVQAILTRIRRTIRRAAPDAEEAISYQMPTFKLEGNLVHFAAHQRHIGFYPAPVGMAQFKQALAPYKRGRGSVQFPLDQPIPLELIGRIVRFRVKAQKAKAAARRKK